MISLKSFSLPGREADHSPPSNAEVREWVVLYLHYPNTPSWSGAQLQAQGQLYLYFHALFHVERERERWQIWRSVQSHLVSGDTNYVAAS